MSKTWRYTLYSIFIVLYYLFLLVSPAVYFNDSSRSDNKVTITGHRGAAGYAPENTLASIRKALEIGVDRIEIDIHQSIDSIVVVLHDETVDRTSNGTGVVREMYYKDLRKLDVGSFFSAEFKGEKIPSFEEVLQVIDGKCDLLIEFKNGNDHYPRIEEHVLELINKYDASSWCMVHSFNINVLERIHLKAPSLKLHKLFIANLRFTSLYVDIGIGSFNPSDYPYIEEYSINEYFGNRTIINQLHLLGKKVNIWTLNDPKRIEAYKELGIDGIISDFPDIIQ